MIFKTNKVPYLLPADDIEQLREQVRIVTDLRSLMAVSRGMDSEHKWHLLESESEGIFSAEQLTKLAALSDDELDQHIHAEEIRHRIKLATLVKINKPGRT